MLGGELPVCIVAGLCVATDIMTVVGYVCQSVLTLAITYIISILLIFAQLSLTMTLVTRERNQHPTIIIPLAATCVMYFTVNVALY